MVESQKLTAGLPLNTHTYPQSKIVDEVTTRESEGGHWSAYLHAAPDADPQKLYEITCKLAERGWRVTPYSIGSKPLLQVQEFPSEKKLVDFLEQSRWATGTKQYVPEKGDKVGLIEQVKKRSLGFAGAAYGVGDLCFTQYGYQGGNPLNFAAGILYGMGTASVGWGGRKDPSDLQIKDIAKRMARHFRAMGVELPPDCSLKAITEDQNKGLIKSADDIIRRYPSELMNLFFAAAGACIAIASYKHYSDPISDNTVKEVFSRLGKRGFSEAAVREKVGFFHKVESVLDIGLGGLTGLSGLFAMLVKEKKRDPDDPPKGKLEAAWDWIREKPLAIAGIGYMASTMCHAVSTTLAWNFSSNERRKSVKWRAGFVAANLIAEVLLAISSKGHGEGVKSNNNVDNTVLSLAAELITRQPKAMQDFLINHMADFLARPDVLSLSDKDTTQKLYTLVEAMRQNPWAQVPEAKKTVLPAPAAQEDKDPSFWEAKMALRKAAEVPMQMAP